jgi:hypothetical protein
MLIPVRLINRSFCVNSTSANPFPTVPNPINPTLISLIASPEKIEKGTTHRPFSTLFPVPCQKVYSPGSGFPASTAHPPKLQSVATPPSLSPAGAVILTAADIISPDPSHHFLWHIRPGYSIFNEIMRGYSFCQPVFLLSDQCIIEQYPGKSGGTRHEHPDFRSKRQR